MCVDPDVVINVDRHPVADPGVDILPRQDVLHRIGNNVTTFPVCTDCGLLVVVGGVIGECTVDPVVITVGGFLPVFLAVYHCGDANCKHILDDLPVNVHFTAEGRAVGTGFQPETNAGAVIEIRLG